jgi:hypothetical protein
MGHGNNFPYHHAQVRRSQTPQQPNTSKHARQSLLEHIWKHQPPIAEGQGTDFSFDPSPNTNRFLYDQLILFYFDKQMDHIFLYYTTSIYFILKSYFIYFLSNGS